MPVMGKPERTPSEKAARSAVWTVLALMLVLSAIVGAGGWALAHTHLDLGLSGSGNGRFAERRRLAPIAILPSACTPLESVRTSTAELTDFWDRHLFGHQDWTAGRVALTPKLERFELAVVLAEKEVPPRVRTQFEVVAKNVEYGRTQLATSTDAWAYVSNSGFFDGWNALSDASDLVGNACGAPLLTARPYLGGS